MSVTPKTWPTSLPLPLERRSHALMPQGEAVRMESQRVRVRRLYEEPVEIVTVQWNFTSDQFEDFETFFATTLEHGEFPFTMEWEGGVPQTLAFVEASYHFNREDSVYSVQAALEIVDWNLDAESWDEGSGAESSSEESGGVGEDSDSGEIPPEDSIVGEGSEALPDDSGGEPGSGGGEYPPPPNLTPIWPTPEPWFGSGYWGPVRVTDPLDLDSAYVAIPDVDDPDGYIETWADPGCVEAWVWWLWMDFLDAEVPYENARIIWVDCNLTGSNFLAQQVFPNQLGGYQNVAGLNIAPVVEYR